jgi:hypothetical protein
LSRAACSGSVKVEREHSLVERFLQPVGFVFGEVNTPPPKGGGFGLRLEAGLIDPSGRFDQTTLKLSSGSSGF